MDIGTGIAIAAVWAVPITAMISERVNGLGVLLALTIAMVMTVFLK